jgi:hypothetical protein
MLLFEDQLSPNYIHAQAYIYELLNKFLKKTTVTSLELDNKIISLYLCIFQRNQIKSNKTIDYIYIYKEHGGSHGHKI